MEQCFSSFMRFYLQQALTDCVSGSHRISIAMSLTFVTQLTELHLRHRRYNLRAFFCTHNISVSVFFLPKCESDIIFFNKHNFDQHRCSINNFPAGIVEMSAGTRKCGFTLFKLIANFKIVEYVFFFSTNINDIKAISDRSNRDIMNGLLCHYFQWV